MDKNKALQKLLNGTATEEEIELLKQALIRGEISIGGDVNRSVVIIGSGNKVELTAEALGILKPESKSEEPVEGDPPYMGMRYFDTADAGLFYGREALTRELAARVAKENFLAIVGASGSGKSSVARAGLIPAWNAGIVESGKRLTGAVYILTPTAHPLENLAASLTRESESVTATSILMDDLKNDARSLRLYIRKLLSQSGGTNLLLLVDQFEETFTLCKDPDERKAFIDNLLEAASEDDGAARVVLTLRADFYHHCFDYEGLRLALGKHQANIGAMTADELREAITAPAEAAGWDFQPGLVDLILRDLGAEPGVLPLLSHALLETWKRRQRRTLTLQGYHDAGGVLKAIAQTAESVYDRLLPAEQTIARGIFLRLTRLVDSDEGRDTRKRVAFDNLIPLGCEAVSINLLLDKLAIARLIVKTVNEDKIEVEVAHEALISHWKRLRGWLNEDRDNLRLCESVSEDARRWENAGRDDVLLNHRGGRLDDALSLSDNSYYGLTESELEYLDACVMIRERDRIEREEYQLRKLEEVDLQHTKASLEDANRELQVALIREQRLANTDALTGINNRHYWYQLAKDEFLKATHYQQPLSVIMFDIDHFKEVNDAFGHAIGDQILQRVTQIACAELRPADVIGRYGGEDFVIILPKTNAQQAYSLAEHIRAGVEAMRVPTENGDAAVTLSIGIVEMIHDVQTGSVEELVHCVEEALYAAKQAGRNRTEIGN